MLFSLPDSLAPKEGKKCLTLSHLGILYDSFDITYKGAPSTSMGPQKVVLNVKKVHEYIQSTGTKVKKGDQVKEDSATNGPQGTVSQKTQTLIGLPLNGINNLVKNLPRVNAITKNTSL